jgi:sugar phosphate isomerase/epimerase
VIRLSAFGDEISPDLDEQIAVLRTEGIHSLDLRSIGNKNVLELSDEQLRAAGETLAENDVRVSCIASPLGKSSIADSFDHTLEGLARAIEIANRFQAPFIRIFSFYPSPAVSSPEYRRRVIHRLAAMAERCADADVILLHENDTGLYGDTARHSADLLRTIESPHLRAVFDPANAIYAGDIVYPDAYRTMQPWIRYLHVKDAVRDGPVTAAGDGAADWPDLLQQLHGDGYDGVLALEPHLQAGGPYGGFSGPELFRVASQALQKLLRSIGWEYA